MTAAPFATLEAFRASLPAEIRDERLHYLDFTFDVVAGYFLVHKLDRASITLDVARWAGYCGLEYPAAKSDSTIIDPLRPINDAVALGLHIDEAKPVLYGKHVFGRGKNKETVILLIDGHHRLRRAWLKGIPTIQGFGLDEKELKSIRV